MNYCSGSWVLSPKKYSTRIRFFSLPCPRALAKSAIAVAAAHKAWSPICGYSSSEREGKRSIGGSRFKIRGKGGIARSSKIKGESTSIWGLPGSD